MESKNLLVHMSPAVIKSLAAFVYLGVLKDIFVGCFKRTIYNEVTGEGMNLQLTKSNNMTFPTE